jgi:magnesium transporter
MPPIMDANAAALSMPFTADFDQRLFRLISLAPADAAKLVAAEPDTVAVNLLIRLNQSLAREVLLALSDERRAQLLAAAPADYREQWSRNANYPDNSVGHLMRPAVGALPENMPVTVAIEQVRHLTRRDPITYLFATDRHDRLTGVVVLRDLFLASPERTLAEIMIQPPFFLRPDMTLLEAMRATVSRHYPVYPVCDEGGHLLGLVRGQALFEKQAYLISAQPGAMEGVRAQERLSTKWRDSFRLRQPWLQLNFALSLVSVLIVGFFHDAIQQLIVLAAFLSVISAQARNSGAQTMAITLRGLSTGEWHNGRTGRVLAKEIALGTLNGALVGVLCALLIVWLTRGTNVSHWSLGLLTLGSMAGSCGFSGLCGVLIPLGLRAIGADPALAASIIMTTIATVVSQTVFLGLAALSVAAR